MPNYAWLPLHEILKYEPEMKRLKVSEVARSPRGFLTAYKRVSGALGMSWGWHKKRAAFIARHLVQYKKNPTYRRWLALVCWAYRPDKRFG
jgi:hypothetical protein